MLLSCPKAEFKQYIVNNNHCDGSEMIKTLRKATGEDESCFRRSLMDAQMPVMGELFDKVNNAAEEVSSENKPRIHFIRSVREEDEQNIETARAFYKADIVLDEKTIKNGDLETYRKNLEKKLHEVLAGQPVSMKITTVADLRNDGTIDKDRKNFFTEDYFKNSPHESFAAPSVVPALLPVGFENNKCLLRIYMDRTGDIVAESHTPKDKEEKIQFCSAIGIGINKLIQAGDYNVLTGFIAGLSIFRDSIKNNDEALKSFDESIAKITESNDNNDTKENETMETNYLDRNNPGSDNQAAGLLTTRELLKELSGRGVTFDGLAITIKQDIDINAI